MLQLIGFFVLDLLARRHSAVVQPSPVGQRRMTPWPPRVRYSGPSREGTIANANAVARLESEDSPIVCSLGIEVGTDVRAPHLQCHEGFVFSHEEHRDSHKTDVKRPSLLLETVPKSVTGHAADNAMKEDERECDEMR